MSTETSRLGLDEPQASDTISGFPADDVEALGILDNAWLALSGTLASRPVASLAGRTYFATDVGLEFDDNGTTWTPRVMGYAADGYKSGGSALGGPGWSNMLIDTVVSDPGGCFQSGEYIAPRTGRYLCMGQTAVIATVANVELSTGIYVNGTLAAQGTMSVATAVGSPAYTNVTRVLPVTSGQPITLVAYNNSSDNQNIELGPSLNYLSIQPLC